jgi:hypothetical protein
VHQQIKRQRALGENAQRIDFDFRYLRIAADQCAEPSPNYDAAIASA